MKTKMGKPKTVVLEFTVAEALALRLAAEMFNHLVSHPSEYKSKAQIYRDLDVFPEERKALEEALRKFGEQM
jgi:hypothetical protein